MIRKTNIQAKTSSVEIKLFAPVSFVAWHDAKSTEVQMISD